MMVSCDEARGGAVPDPLRDAIAPSRHPPRTRACAARCRRRASGLHPPLQLQGGRRDAADAATERVSPGLFQWCLPLRVAVRACRCRPRGRAPWPIRWRLGGAVGKANLTE
jgi:hypothetical protein